MINIPDILKVKNSNTNMLMENEEVRVMDMRLKTGQRSPMHNHPHDHVIYVFKDAKFKLTFPSETVMNLILKRGRFYG